MRMRDLLIGLGVLGGAALLASKVLDRCTHLTTFEDVKRFVEKTKDKKWERWIVIFYVPGGDGDTLVSTVCKKGVTSGVDAIVLHQGALKVGDEILGMKVTEVAEVLTIVAANSKTGQVYMATIPPENASTAATRAIAVMEGAAGAPGVVQGATPFGAIFG